MTALAKQVLQRLKGEPDAAEVRTEEDALQEETVQEETVQEG